jgi:ATP-dependent RNA circularization protein (DNA/RNA ligase family)
MDQPMIIELDKEMLYLSFVAFLCPFTASSINFVLCHFFFKKFSKIQLNPCVGEITGYITHT